jgi:hypothetical protein
MVETDPRTLAWPETLRDNPNNPNFIRDSRGIMEPDSAINYQFRLALETLVGLMAGVTEYKLDIPLNELVKKSRYRRRNGAGEWTRFQEWEHAPKLDDASGWLEKHREFYDTAVDKEQEASLHFLRLAAKLKKEDPRLVQNPDVPLQNGVPSSNREPRSNREKAKPKKRKFPQRMSALCFFSDLS